MAEKVKKITFDVFGKEYEFAGGGGEGSQPAHDSVGSDELKNGSVEMEDLSPDVKANIADRVSQDDLDKFKV